MASALFILQELYILKNERYKIKRYLLKKTTTVKQSPLNGVKLLLAIGLVLGFCLLLALSRSNYSNQQQALFLLSYALVWSLACIVRIYYLQKKSKHHA
jgi:ABC-type nickel/cobalt efflux system permease component RcnA